MKWPRRRDDDQPWESSGSLALGLVPATASNTAGDSSTGDQGAVAQAKLLEELCTKVENMAPVAAPLLKGLSKDGELISCYIPLFGVQMPKRA